MTTTELTKENLDQRVASGWARARRLLGRVVRPVPPIRPGLRCGVQASILTSCSPRSTPRRSLSLLPRSTFSSIPTVMVVKDGHLVFSQPGAMPAAALEQLVEAVVQLDVEAAVAERSAS